MYYIFQCVIRLYLEKLGKPPKLESAGKSRTFCVVNRGWKVFVHICSFIRSN